METGRKHQIRAQLAGLGHPICGDSLYGAQSNPTGRLCLHATQLGFRHPGTGQQMDFASPPPGNFWTLAGAEPPAELPQRAGAAPRTEMPTVHPAPPPPPGAFDTSWDHVAEWYDQLVDEEQSDHYRDVILPGTVHLLGDVRGKRILDVACGQGVLSRHLASLGASVVGVDASAGLIDAARRRGGPGIEYHVADVRQIGTLELGRFDAAASVMAVMNIDPLDPVLAGCARQLRPGGALVLVMLHPAFRAPRQTSWGFEATKPEKTWLPKPAQRAAPKHKGGPHRIVLRQYRRVEGYLSTGQFEIVMNPGQVAHGKPKVTTWTFHRPLQTYVKLLDAAGFLIEGLEEWPSLRRSAPGRNAAEENRARREIPLFLGLRAIARGGAAPA
jgi:2-polyprenyl-3-methyl-5-hydroxy-6-metoxy-1,4-benzoquinol methylase